LAKFPEPPPSRELAKIPPAIRTLPAGTGLWRLYFRRGNHPVSWNTFRSYGPVESSRFDHQISPGQPRSILYTADDIGTCYPAIHGLHYPSSMYGNRASLALYERAMESISRSPVFHRPLADPALRPFLARTAREIGYKIV
jgi:hypothetical protein